MSVVEERKTDKTTEHEGVEHESVPRPTPHSLTIPRNPEVGPPRTASARQVLTFKNRVLVAAAVVVASYVPAASALALSGTNHNETLLLDA